MKQMEKDVIIYNAIGSFFVFFGVLREKKMMEDGQMIHRINLWNPLTWIVLFIIVTPVFLFQSIYEGVPCAIAEAKQFFKEIIAQK